LLLAATGYSVQREEAQLRALLGWFPSAVVVTGRRHTDGALALMRAARERGTPVIEMWDHRPDASRERFIQIGFDHAEVGRAMAAHLIERGHRTLAWVDSGVAEDFRAHERGGGFLAEARRRRVPAQRVAAPPGEAIEAGRHALIGLLEGGRSRRSAVRAAAFANDHLACGALLEAHARGVAVPSDIALLGFGDFALGRQLEPALSTVRTPRVEIGQATAQAVLQAVLEGTTPRDVRLPWQVLARAST
jgi:LacI family gluconate utilization system Gnt-I transcriptional repressor